ncbi:flagellar assembly protein FliW [Oceanobacillus sp. FSL H7-0719]|uniref:flagellar assembly protein FliW n=1 Tax=Oceanobacillus sp. FSL H7-0719 TaxID=2954507 RepID=UPI00324DE222
MKLQTKYLGEIEVQAEKIIHFPKGLPGFQDETEFIILDLPDNTAFQLLQSVKTSALAFVITSPYLFYQDYTLNLNDDLIELLEIKKQEDVAVYNIVTLKNPFSESTINLRAPIIINTSSLLGKQYILNDSPYSSRAAIAPAEKGAK